MVRDINGLGTPPNSGERPARDSGKVDANKPQQQPAPARTEAPTGAATQDRVALSSGVQTLREAEQKLARQPDVNDKRVAEIRAALDSGSYQVDDLVVADKLLGFDDLYD